MSDEVNPYDTATIRVRKLKGKGNVIYAELRDCNDNLLVSATLDYVVNVLKLRMTEVQEWVSLK